MTKQSRRTKYEMVKMEIECEYYLLQTKNNPHNAYNLFIKEYLENNRQIPYYVKGIKDFIKVSKQLELKLNKDKIKDEKKQDVNNIIDYIMNLELNELISIYKEYKNKVNNTDKLILVDLINAYNFNSKIDKNDLNDRTIDLFRKIMDSKVA